MTDDPRLRNAADAVQLSHAMAALCGVRALKILLAAFTLVCISQIKYLQNGSVAEKQGENKKNIRSEPVTPLKPEPPAERFDRRYRRLQDQCEMLSPNETYDNLCGHVLENRAQRLSWCYAPKTGCTFWKKVFYILQKRSQGLGSMRVSELNFRQTHTAPIDNLCKYRKADLMAHHMSEQNTLIVVRNPYSRIFSAYIDKLLLPDHWHSVGVHIARNYRANSTALSKRCGHDVTFAEFIRYVIHVGETGSGVDWFYDDHWLPISKVCLPCQLPYKHIAKQETFASDRDFLFEKFGLHKYFEETFSRNDAAILTMSQRIDAFWVGALRTGCIQGKELMQRFWTAFQLQGYLPLQETLTENLETLRAPVTKTKFKNLVRDTFLKYKNVSLRQQKVQGMLEAYKTLTLSQLRKIQTIYRFDFQLFGYDGEPKDLYSIFISQN